MSATAPTTEQTAAKFVEQQLAAAERSLKVTRCATSIIVVLIVGYAVSITTWMHYRVLEPSAAADIATAHTVTFVQESGTALSDQIVQELPALVRQAPDFLIEQMPNYRIQLEDKFEQTLADCGRELQPDVEGFLDQFVAEHCDQVASILDAANDPKMTKQFGDKFEEELVSYLKTPNDHGESVLDMLDQGRIALEDVQQRLHRLAHDKDLTPSELKLRRLVATTLKATDVKL